MTDQEIEEAVRTAGGQWDGNVWRFEDADLHPFVRSILATRPAAATSTPCASGEAVRLARGESHPVIEALRALPAYRHNEIDGEESDGTPRYWRDRPFVSLRSVERIVLEALKGSAQ